MKKKILAALVLSAVMICGLAALAVGGSPGDPLISLSYITDTFLPRLTADAGQRADEAARADYEAALGSLDAVHAVYAARAGLLEGDWTYCDLYERRGYQRSDVIRLTPGSGVLFLEGTASALADGGELVDVTGAAAAASMEHLIPGHRYLAGENAIVSITILSDAAYLAPQGYSCAALSGIAALPFTDLVSTSWYYDYVHYVCNAGLFHGVSETQFSPAAFMNRAMLATVLYRLAGSPVLPGESGVSFTDVSAGSWYETPVTWAAAGGIVNGMGGGLYMPDSNVTREQMAVMLHRYAAGYAGLPVTAAGDLSGFPDADRCSDWAKSAVSWAVGAGIIGGRTDGVLDPGGTATRAEVAAMLQRFSALFA